MTMYWFQNRYLFSFFIFAAAIVVSQGVDLWLGSTIAVLLILQLSIVIIAFQCNSRMAYIVAILEALSFNFFFTTPRHSLQMFHLDDSINLVVFLVVAFTTSQLAERYRRQQDELKQAQLRNQILLSVSHDLRTPLAGIIGNLTTLKEYLFLLSDKEKYQLLDSATIESHRLHQYIENLLQATKLQHGAMVVRKSQESLINILNNVIDRFDISSELIVVTVEGAIDSVSVSRSLIEQAFFNVLDNALRYSPKGSFVEVVVRQETGFVVVDIHNDGQSPNAGESELMFKLFYSGDKTKNADSGSGLGLAVAKGVITAHEGFIECIEVKKGCLIRICLPLGS
ncbi:DUF4118 domain-containing protein [Shewanella sp. GutDb-MelDb]|uniref:sensor histidine kinase n=1 Tax=Shewanella sp. GutDb-MelDb TaxID=2058316 RepID=UPI001C60D33E|nr:DUF4118 domain-containing protein [Shewanella sp. GutDb-MelDb]